MEGAELETVRGKAGLRGLKSKGGTSEGKVVSELKRSKS